MFSYDKGAGLSTSFPFSYCTGSSAYFSYLSSSSVAAVVAIKHVLLSFHVNRLARTFSLWVSSYRRDSFTVGLSQMFTMRALQGLITKLL